MLVAGSTGSGKSVCINNIIMSIIMRTTPDEVKMVLVDPKKVEFSVYDGIPHLLMPVVTDPKKANVALQKIVVEMDERYDIFKNSGTKNIISYNEEIEKELKKNPDCGKAKMPYILVIIDELADLMLVAAKEVEESIMRITQLARAAGIHLIVATQRPSTNVVTGVIKANIPTRVSFAVSSSIDSRTILDMTGAEKLLGRGDMLYKPQDENTPTRVQGSFVSDGEIKRVVDACKKNSSGPRYSDKFENLEKNTSGSSSVGGGDKNECKDVLYDEVLNYAIRMGQISASLIQRKYSIGYNRAARIVDLLEERGIIGPQNGSKPREVLVKRENNDEE
jgi:S-DNA-T family DNA segregation ATPase FtsK/SpoIIIE